MIRTYQYSSDKRVPFRVILWSLLWLLHLTFGCAGKRMKLLGMTRLGLFIDKWLANLCRYKTASRYASRGDLFPLWGVASYVLFLNWLFLGRCTWIFKTSRRSRLGFCKKLLSFFNSTKQLASFLKIPANALEARLLDCGFFDT